MPERPLDADDRSGHPPSTDALPGGLVESHRAWIRAVGATDVDAYADVVCEDVVWLPPGGDPVEGRAAFRRWLAPFFEAYDYDFTIDDAAISVTGGYAVEKARFRSAMTSRSGGETMEHEGRFIVLWRRDDDGRWRIDRYVDDTGEG